MAANMQCTLCYFPANFLKYTPFDIFPGQARLAFAPDLDTFKQSARVVIAGLTYGKNSVKMHMRIDKRGNDQPTSHIYLACRRIMWQFFRNSGKVAIPDSDVDQTLVTCQLCMAK